MGWRIFQVFVVAAILAAIGGVVYDQYYDQQALLCDLCGRHLHQETAFRIRRADGNLLEACCPRCGFHSLKDTGEVAEVQVADYPSGELIDARQAFYLEGSNVQLCSHQDPKRDPEGNVYHLTWDRCTPSLLGFKEREELESFRLQHGGETLAYADLVPR